MENVVCVIALVHNMVLQGFCARLLHTQILEVAGHAIACFTWMDEFS